MEDSPEEIWKQIEGYKDYFISNQGRVLSKKNRVAIILKPWKQSKGYLQVELYQGGSSKSPLVHRLVAQAFVINIDDFPQVDHLNRDKTDNRSVNLEWKTNRANNINKESTRPVYKIDPATNEILKKFDSLSLAADEATGYSEPISAVCKKEKKLYKGFKYEFVKPVVPEVPAFAVKIRTGIKLKKD
jgi:hypothetical protein